MVEFEKVDEKTSQEILVNKAKRRSYKSNKAFTINIGIIGVFAGHIILPVLGGILLGGWLDRKFPHDVISWRLNCIFVGLAIGYLDAWLWLRREGKLINKDYDDEKKELKEKTDA